MRLLVGVTGASGAVYALKLLEALRDAGDVEVHLVVSDAARDIVRWELGVDVGELERLAHRTYGYNELSAPIASGSFRSDGMVVIPCSMKTLAGIAHGYSDNLILRAADVTLKMRRPLILVVRETPYSIVHIRNMLAAAEAGAVIVPASPAFYHKPRSIDDLVGYVVGRVLELLGIEYRLYREWRGPQESPKA